MEDGKPILGSLFVYVPNKAAPVFFTVAFAASAVGHIWQCYHYKCWKLIGLHPLCAVLFAGGYALREYGAFNYLYVGQSSHNTPNLLVFVMSQVLIYVCPPLLELANYHVLGHIFYYVPYFAPLPAGRVLSTFGALMVFVETLNALGIAISSKKTSTGSLQELGSRLTIAALAIQLFVILVFVVLAAIFHRRCAKAKIKAKAVSTLLITMYMSMALILIRCIYRLVEHMGYTTVQLDNLESLKALSPILRYEAFFYVFEGTLMLINSVLWNVWNPGRYLPKNYHVYLAQDGRTELEWEDQSDDRSLTAKTASILTFGILYRKKRDFRPLGELNGYSGSTRQV